MLDFISVDREVQHLSFSLRDLWADILRRGDLSRSYNKVRKEQSNKTTVNKLNDNMNVGNPFSLIILQV